MDNALSRHHLLLTEMRSVVPGFDVLPDSYPLDPFFGPIVTQLTSGTSSEYAIIDGFLFWGVCLCILQGSMRLLIISELHGVSHVGRDRTISLIQRRFFWPTLRRDASQFFEWCRICQVSNGTSTNAGLYLPLPVPSRPWAAISMDFVVWAILTKDRYPAHEYNKLSARKVGPFEIVQKINSNAYRLKLPSHIRTSDVFNIKHLIPFTCDNSSGDETGTDSRVNRSSPGEDDGDETALMFLEKYDRVRSI